MEHEFEGALIGDNHERLFDKAKEKQANFMAAELLIPEAAARKAAYAKLSNVQVALAYGVSEQFAQMRMARPRVLAQRAAKRFGFVY